MSADGSGEAQANLEKVDHVVVLMLENRSFDHMLGYLSLQGGRPDIDGLRPGFANEYQGRAYPIHHLDTTAVPVDPDHSARAVDLQVADGRMDGFAASLMATYAGLGVQDGDASPVMGYYDGADVPVYDHLAEEFSVCDRWFSSVPGATWPNRLYALCGRAAGSRDDLPPHMPPDLLTAAGSLVVCSHRVLRTPAGRSLCPLPPLVGSQKACDLVGVCGE
jgi:phospholipase C